MHDRSTSLLGNDWLHLLLQALGCPVSFHFSLGPSLPLWLDFFSSIFNLSLAGFLSPSSLLLFLGRVGLRWIGAVVVLGSEGSGRSLGKQ